MEDWNYMQRLNTYQWLSWGFKNSQCILVIYYTCYKQCFRVVPFMLFLFISRHLIFCMLCKVMWFNEIWGLKMLSLQTQESNCDKIRQVSRKCDISIMVLSKKGEILLWFDWIHLFYYNVLQLIFFNGTNITVNLLLPITATSSFHIYLSFFPLFFNSLVRTSNLDTDYKHLE